VWAQCITWWSRIQILHRKGNFEGNIRDDHGNENPTGMGIRFELRNGKEWE